MQTSLMVDNMRSTSTTRCLLHQLQSQRLPKSSLMTSWLAVSASMAIPIQKLQAQVSHIHLRKLRRSQRRLLMEAFDAADVSSDARLDLSAFVRFIGKNGRVNVEMAAMRRAAEEGLELRALQPDDGAVFGGELAGAGAGAKAKMSRHGRPSTKTRIAKTSATTSFTCVPSQHLPPIHAAMLG